MPWKIYGNCVHKENADGSQGDLVPGGCHKTHVQAVAHLRALYASEAKEITDATLDLLKEIANDADDNKPERASAVLDEWKARIGGIPDEEEKKDSTEITPETVPSINLDEKTVEQFEETIPAEEKSKSFDIQERKWAIDHAWGEMFPETKPTPVEVKVDSPWISAYLDNSIIVGKDGKYYKVSYTVKGDTVELQGQSEWTEVVRNSEWIAKAWEVNKDYEEYKARRSDVSAADRKRAESEYGDVSYADEENKKYPIDTETHIRAAWSYINMPKNAAKYSSSKVSSIKSKIIAAWKKKIEPKGPPSAKKDLLGKLKEIGDAIMSWFKDEPIDETGISIWKQGNQYWWLARYSNKFRDKDYPPEIISSDSHKRFEKLVKEGKAPLPELWTWHKKEWRVGKAHAVAYDDVGFAVAIGTFDVGKESVAEALMKSKEPIKVSHGMPISSIKRNEVDSSIIIEHETREISYLPAWAAANKLTGFVVLNLESKEESMAIPDETKKEWISNLGINPETLESLETANAEDAAKAASEGLESKEVDKNEVAQPATQETTTEPKPEPVKEVPTVTLTVDELKNAVQEAITGIVAPVLERVNTLEAGLKELKEVSEKQKALLEGTPTASMNAWLGQFAQSVIGAPETRVDGRTSIAQSKPKETAANVAGRTNIPFIDEMLAGN